MKCPNCGQETDDERGCAECGWRESCDWCGRDLDEIHGPIVGGMHALCFAAAKDEHDREQNRDDDITDMRDAGRIL